MNQSDVITQHSGQIFEFDVNVLFVGSIDDILENEITIFLNLNFYL
jgi:hypothetical protein